VHRISKRSAFKTAIADRLPRIPMWLMMPVMKFSSWWRERFSA
jgi:hypothetical protein